MSVLCKWIMDAPGKWASCVRLARNIASKTTRNQVSVNSYLRPIHAMLDLVGVPSPPWADRPKVGEDCDVSDATFKCQDCPSVFNTLQSLQRQCTSAHAISTPGTQWVTSNGVCMGCLKLFLTKLRLHRHLQFTHAGLTCPSLPLLGHIRQSMLQLLPLSTPRKVGPNLIRLGKIR